MEAVTCSVSSSIIPHRSNIRYLQRRNWNHPRIHQPSLFPLPSDLVAAAADRTRRSWWRASARRDDDEQNSEEVERAMGMDGSIPGTSGEFLRRVSSRAYDMRRHLNQTLDSVSYDVLENNPWRDDMKPVYVLTHKDNQLCTMKTRQNRSEVERELGLLFSKGRNRGSGMGSKAKQSRTGTSFNMFVEDIREGVLVFEDEDDATKYCDLLQGGGQGCEGIAELEASSVFDICHRMRALAVLFRRGRTPPLPKSLEQNLRARKRSLEDQDNV